MYITIEAYKYPNEEDFHFCACASRLSHKQNKMHTIEQDIDLLSKLVLHGDDEAKSLRGLQVYYAIRAPRYFFQEFVTYRLGHEQLGSESTMHSAPKFETEDDFIHYK